jgi:hypothetical protein
MSLQISSALRDGFERTVSVNGLLLMGAFLLFGAGNLIVTQSTSLAIQESLQQFSVQSVQQPGMTGFGATESAFAVALPLPVVLILTLLTVFVAEGLRIVGIRMFAPNETLSPAAQSVQDGLPLAVLNGVVGGIIATVLTVLGLVLFVLPGVFIALSFFFVRQEIALENKNFIEALQDGWVMTRGERLELFGLGVIIFLISLVSNSPATVLFFLSPAVASLLGTVTSAATTVFGIAVVTRAYQQLKSDESVPEQGSTTTHGSQDTGVSL